MQNCHHIIGKEGGGLISGFWFQNQVHGFKDSSRILSPPQCLVPHNISKALFSQSQSLLLPVSSRKRCGEKNSACLTSAYTLLIRLGPADLSFFFKERGSSKLNIYCWSSFCITNEQPKASDYSHIRLKLITGDLKHREEGGVGVALLLASSKWCHLVIHSRNAFEKVENIRWWTSRHLPRCLRQVKHPTQAGNLYFVAVGHKLITELRLWIGIKGGGYFLSID